MKNLLKKFVKDEQGLELSEYAIMIALLLVVAVAVIEAVGGHISDMFQQLDDKLTGTTAG